MRRWWSENGVRTITGLTFAVLVSLLLGFVPLARHHSASSVAVEIGSLSQTQWLVGFLRAPSPNDRAQFRTARQIDAHFKSVPHFGSLAGSSVGVRWMYAVAHLLTANKRDAVMRWLGIAMVACSAWLVVALAWRTGGAGVGSVAGLLFLLLPGTLFYGRSVSAESAMLFATSLTVYAYFRGLERRAWAIASGLAFGLAVITAIESLFLIVPLTALSLTWPQDTADRDARREATPPHVADVDRGRIRLAATWLTPLWLLVCGVGIYVVAHPHLWGAAKGPLIDAIVAELKRPHPQALFFGTVSPRGATPSFATTVELLLTRLPLVVLLSFALGVLFSLRQSARPLVGSSRAVLRGILLVLVALVVAHGLLGSPFYAGTNQLLLYWPWIAIGAAFGLFELGTRITTALSFTERRASM
ncbi:MAG: glycosyltransferase family 39 protein, partial [Myxococcales bacterium]|nr:glycosyltransferase family 39 protein [Myxococcales bacterium]